MKKLKWLALIAVAAMVLFSLWMAGFSYGKGHPTALERGAVHRHEWGAWAQPSKLDGDNRPSKSYIQFHTCTNCGLSEYRFIQEEKR